MSSTPFTIADLFRRIENIVRRGRVSAVDAETARVRVDLGDGVTSDWLRWITLRAGDDRTWWAPSTGEQVLLLCESGDTGNGVVLAGIYQQAHPAPENDAAETAIHWADSASATYNKDTHTLEVTLPDAGEIAAHVGEAHLSMRTGEISLRIGNTVLTLRPDSAELTTPTIKFVEAS